jgi:hypothetical protein
VTDVEDLLRQTFRGQESEAGSADGLATGARRLVRDRRRRRLAVAGSLVSVCVIAAGVLALRPGGASQPVAGGTPPGWRTESSLGVEVSVPGDWTVNQIGCNRNSEASTVVRAQGPVALCGSVEPDSKQVVSIGAGRRIGFPGVEPDPGGDRGELRLPDGRFAAWTYLRSRDVTVTIRTRDAALTRRILASAHPVDVDSRGCTTNRPAIDWPAPRTPAQPVRLPGDPASAAVCYYGDLDGGDRDGVLQTSVLLTGADLAALVETINTAPAGPAPDPTDPKACPDRPSEPNALLYFRYPNQRPVLVQVTYNGCVSRAIVDGVGQSMPTVRLVHLFGRVLSTGVSWSDGLPA